MSEPTTTQSKELQMALSFFHQIPFNRHLGLEPTLLSEERCEFRMRMKDELIGNWVRGILHGGAISTALDVTGGAMALFLRGDAWKKNPMAERQRIMVRMGTIDMRVDF